MREILFRGKRSPEFGTGWCYGVPYIDHEGDCIIATHCSKLVVLEETIGQYTGIEDKNGQKIFEGDIVDFFGMHGKIVNEYGAFGITVRDHIDYDLLDSNIPFGNKPDFVRNDNFVSLWEMWWNYEQDDNQLFEVEVIGNIHDNPELLGGEALENEL